MAERALLLSHLGQVDAPEKKRKQKNKNPGNYFGAATSTPFRLGSKYDSHPFPKLWSAPYQGSEKST